MQSVIPNQMNTVDLSHDAAIRRAYDTAMKKAAEALQENQQLKAELAEAKRQLFTMRGA